ncbi:hypothetical protein KAR91_74800, partial [Candidatus Pacearchaeota archaeon]|nr:hypothetical protein [Candidatus Pacearchaeota archaeon]
SSLYMEGDEVIINTTDIWFVQAIGTPTEITVFQFAGSAPTSGHTILRREISAVYLHDSYMSQAFASGLGVSAGLVFRLFSEADFTIDSSGTYTKIIINDAWEDTLLQFPSVTTSLYKSPYSKVFVRRWSNDDYNHGTVVQALLEGAGLTVNAASIATANATSKQLSFTIPSRGESEVKPYRHYLEKIMKSTGGYLSINNDGEVVYELINAASSGDIKSSNEILDNSFSKKIIYSDIVNQVELFNPNNYITNVGIYLNSSELRSTIDLSPVQDDKSQELHDIINTTKEEHFLRDGSTLSSDFLDLRKERRQLITYKSKIDATDIVGDDITYNFKNETNDNTVIKVSKNSKEQTITTTDFHGV